jgi:hypothetical protein
MKMRGARGNAVELLGMATLVCGLLLLAAYGSWGNRARSGKARATSTAINETTRPAREKPSSRWMETYNKLPLSFEENQGQVQREVRYLSHGSGYELFLTAQEAVLALTNPVRLDLSPRHRFLTLLALRKAREASRTEQLTAVHLRFEGANAEPQIMATGEMPGKVNYFIGNDPKKWHTDVPTYARVKYTNIYPGIDLVFYGNQRRLEYDFVVRPGADPKAIRLRIEGARKLRVNGNGNLVLTAGGRKIEFQRPVVYQQVNGKRNEIAGRYALVGDRRVAFVVGNYNRSEPLILDPVLNFSTYLGGSSNDDGSAIAVDASGNVVVAGTTSSTDFPSPAGVNGFQKQPVAGNGVNGATAAFVTEIDPTGTQLKYSTYLAGSAPGPGPFEGAFGVDVDSSGKIYVTGFTASTDFPTNSVVAGFKPTSPANTAAGNSFITKLDPTATGASSLLYSSYIGGTNGTGSGGIGDFGQAVAADQKQNGVVYVTGFTDSTPGASVSDPAGFPVAGGFQASLGSPNGNAFLAKIDTTVAGTGSLLYSTYLGGNAANFVAANAVADIGDGVATDSAGSAYFAGNTYSTNLATTANATQPTYPANNTTNTAFVARIDTTQTGSSSLIYLSYLGGTGPDFIDGIALGGTVPNIAYVTGQAQSSNFPTTAGAFSTTKGALGVAFITLINTKAALSAPPAPPVYSTFVGGNGGTGGEEGFGIKVDSQGNAYVGGVARSASFPLVAGVGPLQPALAPGATGDGFVLKLSPLGNGTKDLLYATYFGGSGDASGDIDDVEAIAIDASNNAYISGHTFSTAASFPVFPTTPAAAFQTALNGPGDAFVAKLTLISTLGISPMSLSFGNQTVGTTSVAETVTLENHTSTAISFPGSSVTFSGTNAADFGSPSNTCGASIAAGASCTVSVTFTPSALGAKSGTLVITVTITNGGISSPQAFDVSLTGTGTATAADFSIAAAAPAPSTVKAGSPATITVTVTPIGGFSSAVAVTCVEPAGLTLSTCTASPGSVTPNGAAITTTVTVTTTAPSLMLPPRSVPNRPLLIRQIVPVLLAFILLLLIPTAKQFRLRLAMATAMVAFVVLAGCAGPKTPKPGTPPGTYSLTITGTSGATVHSAAAVSLTVN